MTSPESTETGGGAERPEREAPVINDRRRIDPETGRRRETGAGQGGAGTSSDAGPGGGGDVPVDAADVPGVSELPGTSGNAVADGTSRSDGTIPADADPAAGDTESELERVRAEALDLQDQLSRRNADLYNVQQEYNGFVRRSRAEVGAQREAGVADVVESLLGVFDDIAAARQHGDLTGPFAAIADKLESTLQQRYGFEQYGAEGEEFDPTVHDALMSESAEGATTTTVTTVLQPGYRLGEKIVRAARVAVSTPA